MKPETRLSIQPPATPVTETDGLIKVSDLKHDVIMHFPIWKDAQPGDAYQITINGQAIE